MTGFGRGVAETIDGVRATVDIRSVNHRYLDCKLRVAVAPALEEAIVARIKSAIARGAITVAVRIAGPRPALAIRRDAAVAVSGELTALARDLGIAGPDLALVLAQPGVVAAADAVESDGLVLTALDAAIAQLTEMRAAEGRALAAELSHRLDELAQLRSAIGGSAASVPAELARRLHDRLRRLLPDDVSIDPQRLAQEVALLAERADITEELVRFDSHLAQARAYIAGSGATGRRLEFLSQELGREINTIGSKASHAAIGRAVVEAKAILEKLREQVQNIE